MSSITKPDPFIHTKFELIKQRIDQMFERAMEIAHLEQILYMSKLQMKLSHDMMLLKLVSIKKDIEQRESVQYTHEQSSDSETKV